MNLLRSSTFFSKMTSFRLLVLTASKISYTVIYSLVFSVFLLVIFFRMFAIKGFLQQLGLSKQLVNKIIKTGYTRMKDAVIDGNKQALLKGKEKGYPISQGGEDILQIAIKNRSNDMVKFILQNFPDMKLEDKTADGDTPLMLATLSNNIEVVQLLVEKGANLNARENEGSTPIIAAAANGFLDILIYLREKGASLDVKNFEGQTALHRACFYGQLSTVRYLSKVPSMRFNRCDKRGNNCAHMAAAGMSIRCLRYISRKVKDQSIMEEQNQEGMTPHKILIMKFNQIRQSSMPHITFQQIIQYLDDKSKPIPIFQQNLLEKQPLQQPKSILNR